MESPSKPGWLRRVQEQSWEPEVLISGIVLFALFQMPARIDAFSNYLELNSINFFSNGTINEVFASILKVSLYWLMIGFSMHLFLRSVWTAYVGLSYTYKEGIQHDRLKFQPVFQRIIEREVDYESRIQQIEKTCSSLFAISFGLFMGMVGAILYLFFIGIFVFLIMEYLPVLENHWIFDFATVFIGGIYLLDFITLGWVKRIPYFSRIYLPIYRLMSAITLSPFYRSIYYGFVTNHKKWKVFLAIFLFVIASVVWSVGIRTQQEPLSTLDMKVSSDKQYFAYQGHYADAMEDKPSQVIQIPSDIIEGNVLRAFVVHSSGYEENQIKPLCNFDAKVDASKTDRDSLVIACLRQFYVLEINDSTFQEVDMLYQENTKTKQHGLVAYLDITYLPKGLHKLNLYYRYPSNENRSEPLLSKRAVVEFYKAAAGNPETEGANVMEEVEGVQGQ